MAPWIWNLLVGFGSVVQISADDAFDHLIPLQSADERARLPWVITGQAIQRSIDQIEREQAALQI